MKEQFDKISRRVTKLTTRAYSTSFSLGIRFFARKYHEPIYGIYGFVRFADEIVDSFHGYDKKTLLEDFKKDTYDAIEQGISMNPILNHFQDVVNQYNIEKELIDQFLRSMEMDLYRFDYDRKAFEEYVLGSAEVVGLMCLRVFTNGDEKDYQDLKYEAMRLGSAFQKINFLRDLRADHKKLGRTYFPGINLDNFTDQDKQMIEKEIEQDFKDGLAGIRKLPMGSRLGVYLAYVYFYQLFKKIRNLRAERIMNERIRISNSRKYSLLLSSYVRHKMNIL